MKVSAATFADGFKPNSQKTKSFFERLEFGTNFQTQKASSYFPVTTDFGLSLGYKLNDKSIVGIGLSYKLGWGENWRNIHLSNQGISWHQKKQIQKLLHTFHSLLKS